MFGLCARVSPVLCVCSVVAEVGMLVLQSSLLMAVLLESRQITFCLADATSGCDASDADAWFVTLPEEKERHRND